ncbi:pentapeptide repeat-containing protein [Nonomuraea phyllanthi]|uniref:Pentapeptide repeat-containing protein n=2 Tax=Nonomuraea phyllanthi TaxID=2219224 RepID=A0A5C4UTR3_9ACTN|nr:pentapeptide repeat-containing protein [Nonomuraea phyllanthi]QFY14256.1 pentapeptide repeat-containing protein [Nonomuraea phyllanthi]
MGLLRRSPKQSTRPPELRPLRSMWWWALPAALLVGAALWGVSAWLLQDLDTVPTAEQISARIEAVRTALAAGAGVGAAVTLLLAVRRQRHQELAAAHTAHDATERRVTELYTKAADQLGSDQAPVRLAGLHALERLAQDTPALRQTIVDVICSYLRMPYTPPVEQDRHEDIRAAQRAARARRPARPDTSGGRNLHEEGQVRRTAQHILTAHLRYQDSPAPHRRWLSRQPDGNPRHWPDIWIDLTGAVLIDFDLRDCRLASAWFGDAQFVHPAWFGGATFTGSVRFGGATFSSDVEFDQATFIGRTTWFDQVTFADGAQFGGTTFSGEVRFDQTTFAGGAWFNGAQGLQEASLAGVRLTPVVDEVVREWPSCWRAERSADGWQTLRLTADAQGTSTTGGEQSPKPLA